MRVSGAVTLIVVCACGCVQRTVSITSEPAGATVWMNDQEIGRTPVYRDFTWYGTYDVQVRAEGYETLNARTPVIAPWWQWPPIDFFAEFIPGAKDERSIHYTLKPATTQPTDEQALLARARQMQSQLESSEHAGKSALLPSSGP